MVPSLLRSKLSSLLDGIPEARNLSFELPVFARPLKDVGVLVFILRSHVVRGGREGSRSKVELLEKARRREEDVNERDGEEGRRARARNLRMTFDSIKARSATEGGGSKSREMLTEVDLERRETG